MHNSQPWQLLIRGDEVDLLEREGAALRRHDPLGRDRMMSCGAALTNLEFAVRSIGRECALEIFDDGAVVATVTIGGVLLAGARDLALFQAVNRRRSYRRRFRHDVIPPAVRAALIAAGSAAGVHLIVPRRLGKLAELLGFATRR